MNKPKRKRYLVSGVCFVAAICETEVLAASAKEAVDIAQRCFDGRREYSRGEISARCSKSRQRVRFSIETCGEEQSAKDWAAFSQDEQGIFCAKGADPHELLQRV